MIAGAPSAPPRGAALGLTADNALVVLWGALATVLLFFATLPLDLRVQAIVAGAGVLAIFALRAWRPRDYGRVLLLMIALFISFRYLFWRATDTLSFVGVISFGASITLFAAEIYGFAIHILGVFVSIKPLRRPPKTAPLDPALLPSVDILVPSYNEDNDLLEVTLLAALSVRYPRSKLNVYLLDDGGTDQKCADPDPAKAAEAKTRRADLKALCAKVGATYLTRPRNEHAKAGNVNEALKSVNGDLVLILDADHVPTVDILERTTPWFIENPNLFLVQSPHFFINPDPIERNLGLFSRMPSENEMFYRVIQPGLDLWNASFFCGSAAVLRRRCLDEIGGLTGETITEDAETALALHSRGYDSVYVDRPMVAGLSPETMAGFIAQRSRWTQGMVQIFLLKNPLLHRGLSLPQRLGYLSASLFWFFPFARLVFLLSPLAYLLFGLAIYDANLSEVMAYTVPHLIAMIAASNFLYGRVRWQFVSELYEVAQSFFCFGAILKVIRRPRSPQFVVTPKGEHLESDFISGLAAPFYIVLVVLFIGAGAGVYRYFALPFDRDLTIVVLAWNAVNIALMIAALGILYERRQRRAVPRVPVDWSATINIPGQRMVGQVFDLSITGAGIKARFDDAVPNRTADPTSIHDHDGTIVLQNAKFGTLPPVPFKTRSAVAEGETVTLGIQFQPESGDDLFAIVKALHSRSEHWSEFQRRRADTTSSMTRQILSLMAHGFTHGLSHIFILSVSRLIPRKAIRSGAS